MEAGISSAEYRIRVAYFVREIFVLRHFHLPYLCVTAYRWRVTCFEAFLHPIIRSMTLRKMSQLSRQPGHTSS